MVSDVRGSIVFVSGLSYQWSLLEKMANLTVDVSC